MKSAFCKDWRVIIWHRGSASN